MFEKIVVSTRNNDYFQDLTFINAAAESLSCIETLGDLMKLKIGGDSELHQLEAANLYAMPMLKNLYLANAVNLVSIR